MTFMLRLSPSNSSAFCFKKTDVFAAYYIRKLFPATNVSKCNDLKEVMRLYYSQPIKKKKIQHPENVKSSLLKISLPVVTSSTSSKLPYGLLSATVQKLSTVYHLKKDCSYFQKEFRIFLKSPSFQNFCNYIEKELISFSPFHLPFLLQLVYFNISPESPFMKKVFKLIMDNINFFNGVDILELYTELNQKPFLDNEECKVIRKACEMFIETYFEEELNHMHDLRDVLHYMNSDNVPLKAKQLITERFLRLIEEDKCNFSIVHKFFKSTFKEPILSLYKPQLIKNFKKVMTDLLPSKNHVMFCKTYTACVLKYEHFYDEGLCEFFLNVGSKLYENYYIVIINRLCSAGYYNENAIDKMSQISLSNSHMNKFTTMLFMGQTLSQVSFHKMNHPNWSKIKSILESYNNIVTTYSSELLEFAEYLISLECDATGILNTIFNSAADGKLTGTIQHYRRLIRLHHICKKYFPDSEWHLSRKLLDFYMQKCAYSREFFSSTNVHEFFGSENFVTYNCYSSDLHFLPIVALIGPDNKPLDLSTKVLKSNFVFRNFSVITNIDHIEKPPGSKLIAFIKWEEPEAIKFHNAPIVSSHLELFLKSYEGCGCDIVLLTPSYFELAKDKQMQYLDSEINKIMGKTECT